MTPRERGYRGLLAAGIVVFLIGFAWLSFPGGGIPFMPLCPFKGMTGLPCPLCGGTRAAHALLRGDLAATLYLNPLAIPAVAGCIIAALVLFYEAASGQPLPHRQAAQRLISKLAPYGLIVLAIWWFPHVYLALRTPKPELIELRNPIAHAAYSRFGPANASSQP